MLRALISGIVTVYMANLLLGFDLMNSLLMGLIDVLLELLGVGDRLRSWLRRQWFFDPITRKLAQGFDLLFFCKKDEGE